MRNRILLAFFAALLIGTVFPLHGFPSTSLTEDVYVSKDETQDSIITFGGNVTIEGRVKQSVVVFGGTIIVSGEVGDSVVGIGSTITLKPTAVVKEDVVSLGGTLTKEAGCTIGGDTVYFRGGKFFSQLFRGGIFSFAPLIPLLLIIKLIGFFVWLLIALVVVAIFPRQLGLASAQIRTSFWPIFGTGFVALILFVGLVIVSAFLSLILIGIPFLLLLIALGFIIKIFGEVALFYFFGESVGKAFRNRVPAPVGAVVLGLIVVSFIKLVPIIGWLFGFCLTIIGWGVAVRTKFGTTENWLKRKT